MARQILILTLLFASVACTSSTSSEQGVQDSTATDTLQTGPTAIEVSQESTTDEPAEPADSSQLEKVYSDLNQYISDSSAYFYEVNVITSQYEASSDVTWYFDNSYSPRYFKETWSMEGTEGSTEYLIENEKVTCALVDESYNVGSATTKWCRQTGGNKSEWGDGADDAKVTPAPADFEKTCNEDLERYIGILKTLLKEGEIISEADDRYNVRLENKIDVGQEVTQWTEVKIDKNLYEQLK